jgi:hypothetical protein
MRCLLPILPLFLAIAAPVRAHDAQGPLKIDLSDAVDPVSAAPPAVAKPDRIFKATLHFTHNDAGFRAAWARDPKGVLPISGTISVAAPLFAVLEVSGCSTGADGACTLAISWRTAGPDGEFDEPRPAANWRPRPDANGHAMLAPAGFRLALDRSDPPGSYTIEATVTDMLGGHKLVVTRSAGKAANEEGR